MNKHNKHPYTYYIIHIPTGKIYYGSRVANTKSPDDDLWKVYFTSSKIIKNIIKVDGKDAFKAFVHKIFENEIDAREYEYCFLQKNNVINDDNWFNLHNGKAPSIKCIIENRWSEDKKEHQSKIMSNNNYDPEFRDKINAGTKERFSKEEEILKQSRLLSNLWKTEEFKINRTQSMKRLETDPTFVKKRLERLSNLHNDDEYKLSLKNGFDKWKNDPDKMKEHGEKSRQRHLLNRMKTIITDDGKTFPSIDSCAEHYGKTLRWVHDNVRKGRFTIKT